MSKVNAIRKKALEAAKKKDWEAAATQYRRLAELDQSNPNVFNELGDVYLKSGNKNEAYDAFVRAADAYARVSLHNNAVAVCKKVLRLIPSRFEVLAKLGSIRKKQGLDREAESFYVQFLDKLAVDPHAQDAEVTLREIATDLPDAGPLLERVAEIQFQMGFKDASGDTLIKAHAAYQKAGAADNAERMANRLEQIGRADEIGSAAAAPKDGAVITEDNIWNESHSDGERISVDGESSSAPASEALGAGAPVTDPLEFDSVDIDAPAPAAASAPDAGFVDLPGTGDSGEGTTPLEPAVEIDLPDPAPAAPETEVELPDPAPAASAAPSAEAGDGQSAWEQAIAEAEAAPAPKVATAEPEPSGSPANGSVIDGNAESISVSAIIGDSDEAEDFRSYYDLGMAYLEMDLLAEAVREFQKASRSPQFQVRSLEMIGLCFIKQEQPALAIKQLQHGLNVVDPGDPGILGIKYHLGLAHELAGDAASAKSMYEDVYVQDVGFRDVGERLQKLS